LFAFNKKLEKKKTNSPSWMQSKSQSQRPDDKPVVSRRPHGNSDIPFGTPQYEALRSHLRKINSPDVYIFRDEPGHVAVYPHQWPKRKEA
jgi:hypothetical protein